MFTKLKQKGDLSLTCLFNIPLLRQPIQILQEHGFGKTFCNPSSLPFQRNELRLPLVSLPRLHVLSWVYALLVQHSSPLLTQKHTFYHRIRPLTSSMSKGTSKLGRGVRMSEKMMTSSGLKAWQGCKEISSGLWSLWRKGLAITNKNWNFIGPGWRW